MAEHLVFVKPAACSYDPNRPLLVRHPGNGRPLEPDGEYVPRNPYWQRRLDKGDVVEAEPPKAAKVTGRRTTIPSTPED